MYYIELLDTHDSEIEISFENEEERDVVFDILFSKSDIKRIEKYNMI